MNSGMAHQKHYKWRNETNLFMMRCDVVLQLVFMSISLSTFWVWTDMIVFLWMCFHVRSQVEVQGECLHQTKSSLDRSTALNNKWCIHHNTCKEDIRSTWHTIMQNKSSICHGWYLSQSLEHWTQQFSALDLCLTWSNCFLWSSQPSAKCNNQQNNNHPYPVFKKIKTK